MAAARMPARGARGLRRGGDRRMRCRQFCSLGGETRVSRRRNEAGRHRFAAVSPHQRDVRRLRRAGRVRPVPRPGYYPEQRTEHLRRPGRVEPCPGLVSDAVHGQPRQVVRDRSHARREHVCGVLSQRCPAVLLQEHAGRLLLDLLVVLREHAPAKRNQRRGELRHLAERLEERGDDPARHRQPRHLPCGGDSRVRRVRRCPGAALEPLQERLGADLATVWQGRTVRPGESPRHARLAGQPPVSPSTVRADRRQLRVRDLFHGRSAGNIHG